MDSNRGNSTLRIKKINYDYTYNSVAFNSSLEFSYEYDALGNITKIEEKYKENSVEFTNIYTYKYDELNQLIREDFYDDSNTSNSFTYLYNYDNNGNILSKKIYNYTVESTPTNEIETITYNYNTEIWRDQLKEFITKDYNSKIDYDDSGNPVTITKTKISNSTIESVIDLEWDGRQLKSYTENVNGTITTVEYTYNDNGIRTSKTINGLKTEYILNGDQVIAENGDQGKIVYTYDHDGKLISFNYNGEEYFYIRNIQGDIVKIADEYGIIVGEYQYDAWGNILNKDSLNDIEKANPYRYRGYRYDDETGWYYLNSRYYNPEIGRFINADGLIGEPGDILGHNMYTYAKNNPVMMVDPSGYRPAWIKNLLIGVAITAAVVLVVATAPVTVPALVGGGALGGTALLSGAALTNIAVVGGAASVGWLATEIVDSVDRSHSKSYATEHAKTIDETKRKKEHIKTVAVLITKDGQMFYGYNSEGVYNAEVQARLAMIPLNHFSGQCAEVNVISKALNAGANIYDAEIYVAKVRGKTSLGNGTPYPPCTTCLPLLNSYNITYMGD